MSVKEDKKYNSFKKYKGSSYSGMKVGATHKWYYDKGEWRERKVTPEEWNVYYKTVKRRAGKAPKNTGAPVGTEYNWLIVAHQRVDKLDANSYMTYLDGKKFKIAHKRAAKEKWSIRESTQRKKVISFLQQTIDRLKDEEEYLANLFTVGETPRNYGLKHQSKTELYQMARELKIPGRSKMDRFQLLAVIEKHLQDEQLQKEKKLQVKAEKLKNKSKSELSKLAEKKHIPKASKMKKQELVEALVFSLIAYCLQLFYLA